MHFNVRDHTHYLVVSGSHSYGLNTPESDVDICGWLVPPQSYWYTFTLYFEQYNEKLLLADSPYTSMIAAYAKKYNVVVPNEPIDCSVYNLRKFMKLASDCNPNIIDLLFVDDNEVLYLDVMGKRLRESASLFLSRRAMFSYTGYAVSQLKRINTHRRWLLNPQQKKPGRADFGLPERSLLSPDQLRAAEVLLEKQVRIWMLEEAEVDKTIIALIQEDLRELIARILNLQSTSDVASKVEAAAGKLYGMSDQYIAVLQQEKRYKSALSEYHSYQQWVEHRNPKRAALEEKYGYDLKHASHLTRLILEAEEILEKGTLHLKLPDRAEFLRSIRAGMWNYDQLMEWVQPRLEKLDDRSRAAIIPDRPDLDKLNAIYGEIVASAFATEHIPMSLRDIRFIGDLPA